jgi:hypothetical protein
MLRMFMLDAPNYLPIIREHQYIFVYPWRIISKFIRAISSPAALAGGRRTRG